MNDSTDPFDELLNRLERATRDDVSVTRAPDSSGERAHARVFAAEPGDNSIDDLVAAISAYSNCHAGPHTVYVWPPVISGRVGDSGKIGPQELSCAAALVPRG